MNKHFDFCNINHTHKFFYFISKQSRICNVVIYRDFYNICSVFKYAIQNEHKKLNHGCPTMSSNLTVQKKKKLRFRSVSLCLLTMLQLPPLVKSLGVILDGTFHLKA